MSKTESDIIWIPMDLFLLSVFPLDLIMWCLSCGVSSLCVWEYF